MQQEDRKRQRKPDDQIKFNAAAQYIISELIAANDENQRGWLFRSLRRETFSASPVKADTFRHVVNGLERLDYIEIIKGRNHRNPFYEPGQIEYVPGLATRFRATLKLIKRATLAGLEVNQYKRHFKIKPKLQQVLVKASSQRYRRQKFSGRTIKYERTEHTKALKRQVGAVNSFLMGQSYYGFEFYGLRRIFNEGDRPDFNWNMGGRLYAASQYNYQTLKKAERLKLKINGEAVAEVDINASFLRILHSLRDFSLPDGEDIYQIDRLDRSIVKAWITSTLGFMKFHRGWPELALETMSKTGLARKDIPSYPSITPLILERFPVLKDWGTCGIRWSNLMFEESEAVIETMVALQNESIPSLPVHDSIIVPQSQVEQAQFVLQHVLEHRFHVPFALGTSVMP